MNTSARGSRLTSVKVSPATLRKASLGWNDQQDTLNRARKQLLAAEDDVGALGSRVTAATKSFLGVWIEELEDQSDKAVRHADNLFYAAANYDAADSASSDDFVSLMPAAVPPEVKPQALSAAGPES